LDQPCQCRTHRVVEIGIGEAALQLQPCNDPLNEDAALLKRYAIGGGPADAIDVNRSLLTKREIDPSWAEPRPRDRHPCVRSDEMASRASEYSDGL
jgi:hypothetical protein